MIPLAGVLITRGLGQVDGDINRLIAKRLSIIRANEGLTLNEMATRLNMKYQTLQKYENGERKITAAFLQNVARALNKPMQIFFPALDPRGTNHELLSSKEIKLVMLFRELMRQESNGVLRILGEITDFGEERKAPEIMDDLFREKK